MNLHITITPEEVILCGERIPTEHTGEQMLVELYRRFVGDWPKFFKMDTCSRLGFVASELLLQREQEESAARQIDQADDQVAAAMPRFTIRKDRAIVFANRSASALADEVYNSTIEQGNYYPSPAQFVYTLPNIVTGEIAIRNGYRGETMFYVLDSPEALDQLTEMTLMKGGCSSCLQAWIECRSKNDFFIEMKLLLK